MNAPLLETVNLKKYFKTSKGNLHAVDNINLQVAEGSTLGIVGESGCGKSTLGRTILRLTEPTEGQILFEGNDICKLSKKGLKDLRKSIQIIFQDPFSSLDPRKCVLDLIAEPLLVNKKEYSKSDVYAKAYDLMDTVGLAERLAYSYPHELDGGRRQRIGIARALSLEPKFIVCDEPVSALDVSIQAQILNLLKDLQKEFSTAYLFISHDIGVIHYMSDFIVVINRGRIVEQGEGSQLIRTPKDDYTKRLIASSCSTGEGCVCGVR